MTDQHILHTGIYKDGHGNLRKLPSSEVDRYYIFKAVHKRVRKNNKRVLEMLKNKLSFVGTV